MALRYFGITQQGVNDTRQYQSLRHRLIWKIAGVVIGSLLLVTSIVIGLMVRYLENTQQEMKQEISFQKLRRFEQRLDYLIETVDRLAENPLVANSLVDAQGRHTYLPKLIDNFIANRDIINVSLVDFDGTAVFSIHESRLKFNEFTAFRRALATHHHHIILSPLKNYIIIVAPITAYHSTTGAIIVTYDLISIAQRIFSEDDGYFEQLVENSSQQIIYSQLQQAIEDYIITPAYPDKTTPYLLNLNLRLNVGILKSKHTTAIHHIIVKFILLSVLATAVATLVAVHMGNGIARPILNICHKIIRSSHADDRTVTCSPVGTNDELEALASAFDQRTAELWEIRDHLEQKVEARTHELRLAHDSLNFLNFALDEHAIVSAADVKGRITYANDRFCVISGYTREELIGHNHRIVKSQEHSQDFYKNMWRQIANGKVWHGEIKNSKRDGGYYWTNATIVPFVDSRNKPFKYISIRTDITKLKRMEAELAAALEVAHDSTKAKSDFLANMSHEIRTPMNAIIGLSDLCLRTALSAKQYDYLNKIHSSANSLLGIINDILDFSKIEARKLDIEEVEFSLNRIISNISTLLSTKAQEKSLELLFFQSPEIPNQLIGDPLRISQVLTNLANNAIKFTVSGEIIVAVMMIESAADTIKLKFSVRDTGVGMTPAQQQGLFKPFFQTDSSITRKYGGTGLGLAISKQLVEMMGGDISVTSTPNVGSIFTFNLVLKVTEQTAYEPSENQSKLPDLHVMIVDDNETSADILRVYLESFSCTVTICYSGEAALDVLRNTAVPVDLIMMDWKMPGINGLETAVMIKTDLLLKSSPKIILVTVFGKEDISHIPGTEYLDNILIKPVTSSLLFNTISEVFGGKSLQAIQILQNNELDMTALHQIQGARILLVEDNEINQQVACEVLKQANLVVEVANHGREALEMLVPGRYECVLMDMQMPIMDGLETTRRIREDARFTNLPILAMTANAMVEDRKRTHDAGMNGHITKPINHKELFHELLRWIPPGKRDLAPVLMNVTNDHEESLPAITGINTAAGIARMSGNVRAYHQLLIKFANNQVNTVSEIKNALDLGDHKLAMRLAHTLKGVASNIGTISLHQVARDLEKALINGNNELLDRSLAITRDELARVIAAIYATRPVARPLNSGSASIAEIIPQLHRLRSTLTQYDAAAEDIIATMMVAISDPTMLAALRVLNEQITQYDFDGALINLDGLIQRHFRT